jgi:hypothetical protein
MAARRTLGQPARQARPGLVIKGLPAQVGPDTLELAVSVANRSGTSPNSTRGRSNYRAR